MWSKDRMTKKEEVSWGYMEQRLKSLYYIKNPQHTQYRGYQGIPTITIPVCEQYSGVLKPSVASGLKDMSGLVFLNKCPCL